MRILGNIWLLLAGTLFLLHTLVPHEHHAELSEEDHIGQHESARSLLDFLQLAFHLDQGKGHLEEYQNADETQTAVSSYFY